ncbi:hypothetical protein P0D69_28045 [Paraburkholderia sediminicola]|uniref:hypothetical protein n=1 Tax=Paraburkholderia sediminicola TaxID=458836 RepID=UPI0038B7532A
MQFDPTKKNNLIVIDKTEVRDYWHVVRAGLEYMCKEGRNPDGWIPEDVFTVVASGNANLAFTSMMRGEDKGMRYASREAAIADSSGFVFLQVLPSFAGKALHIWIAVSNDKTNKADAGSIMRVFNDDLNEIAKAAGCNAITFGSNQSFWETLGPRFGFTKQETKWRRDVK